MRNLKRIMILGIVVLLITGCKSVFTLENEHIEYLSGKYNIEISIKNYGKIKAELDSDAAPITVTHFMTLVRNKFYDGNRIHRILKDFVIQGGQTNEESKTIKGEFLANGVENNISHVRGTISMARAGDQTSGYDTGSTQFFIVQKDNVALDNYYAGFGKVTSGMDVVDKIVKKVTKVDENGNVLNESDMPIIEYIKEIEK